ncbi:MAG: hypothetical protein O6499_01855, partial [Candidatus Dadabacteria bacterium]|nr:hypothetical protein [Candidatus Dadabacteria bacterium]
VNSGVAFKAFAFLFITPILSWVILLSSESKKITTTSCDCAHRKSETLKKKEKHNKQKTL